MNVHGGLVTKSIKFPRRSGHFDTIAVKGVWSGGDWKTGQLLIVQQYRAQKFIRSWQVVSIELITRPTLDTILILQKDTPDSDVEQDDVFVFGKGAFTVFDVGNSNLSLDCNTAIEIGFAHYAAVAKVDDHKLTQLIVFHPSNLTISSQEAEVIWWNKQKYLCQIIHIIMTNGLIPIHSSSSTNHLYLSNQALLHRITPNGEVIEEILTPA